MAVTAFSPQIASSKSGWRPWAQIPAPCLSRAHTKPNQLAYLRANKQQLHPTNLMNKFMKEFEAEAIARAKAARTWVPRVLNRGTVPVFCCAPNSAPKQAKALSDQSQKPGIPRSAASGDQRRMEHCHSSQFAKYKQFSYLRHHNNIFFMKRKSSLLFLVKIN